MAEHANNNTKANLPGLTGERVKAVVTILVTLFSLANAGLSLAGFNPLPFTNEQVSATLFAVIGVLGTIYGPQEGGCRAWCVRREERRIERRKRGGQDRTGRGNRRGNRQDC